MSVTSRLLEIWDGTFWASTVRLKIGRIKAKVSSKDKICCNVKKDLGMVPKCSYSKLSLLC
eukprot:5261558-Amphidinium_carterae.1